MRNGYWEGVFNVLEIDTTPGGAGPFAPPEGWSGDRAAYRQLVRDRYRLNRATHQQIRTAATLSGHVFTGPYAEYAKQIIQDVKATMAPKRRHT